MDRSGLQFLNPPSLPSLPILSQAVVAPLRGRWVCVSGQVAFDREGHLVGAGDTARQIEQAFANLVAALAAAGAEPRHVVKLMLFFVDYTPADIEPLSRTMKAIFTVGCMPTSTLLGVQRLAREGLRFEVQAEAVIPEV